VILALLKAIIAKLPQEKPKAGFTLVEALAVMVMSTIVISSLLALTNQLTRANQREIARTSTQEEMKRALNYMAQELRGAVYVYNGDQLTGITSNLPASFSDNDKTPILAFWKAEPVPYTDPQAIPTDCTKITDDDEKDDCNDLKIERRTYTLVVYAQYTANNDNWEGESRIIRYQLRKFKSDDLKANSTQLSKNTGYVDPEKDDTTFATWPNDEDNKNLQGGRPDGRGNTPVLVDYVDDDEDSNASDSCDRLSREDITAAERAAINALTDEAAKEAAEKDRYRYKITPKPTSTKPVRGFYACVRDVIDSQGNSNNQDVVLFLRGSAEGRSGLKQDDFLPLLQTRVIIRGVINKNTG